MTPIDMQISAVRRLAAIAVAYADSEAVRRTPRLGRAARAERDALLAAVVSLERLREAPHRRRDHRLFDALKIEVE